MPNYAYRCLECKKSFEVFLSYQEFDKTTVACPDCGSENINWRIGRIRFARSDESRLDNFSDPSQLQGLEDDPQALGRMMRQMSREMGEDMGPEFNEVIGRLESGQSPEEIEKALPDLGDDSSPALDEGGDF
ncbi:MAG TPA: FmdB family zinc ribbon protein [Anaerolineales bacterium]|nr:FmdB family zinc ribbon protein [Anaerolineales bacterium]